MNSLSYLSRQFDVLASTSAPSTPPSTPTGELAPLLDSDGASPPLKRIRTWASARAFFFPEEYQPHRRATQPPVRARKRSGSTPNSSRFQLATSVPPSKLAEEAPVPEDSELAAASTEAPTPSMSASQSKSIPTRELSWARRLFFVRIILLFSNWLQAVWDGLTRVPRDESGKGKYVERNVAAESKAVEKESDENGVHTRQTWPRTDLGRTSYVRARASSIMKIVLQPQTKPPTPSPLSQSNLVPPPTFNLIPPDPSEEPERDVRSPGTPEPEGSPSSTLSPQTPPRKRAAQTAATSNPSSPAKTTPLHTRKTLVLDLDETLIHSTTRPLFPSGGNSGILNLGSLVGFRHNRKAGHMVEVVMNGRSTLYHVYKRPFVDYFLRKVSTWYTLVIFTASMKEYADPVIDWLDAGRGMLPLRFFREHCTQLPNGAYSKDLSVLNEDLARICLIDNSPVSYSINKANGIPIEGWTHDPNDEALLDLLPVLDSLRFTSDVRHVLGLRGF